MNEQERKRNFTIRRWSTSIAENSVIAHYEKASFNKALWSAIHVAVADIDRESPGFQLFEPNWDSKALTMNINSELVGLLTYTFSDYAPAISIGIAWVHPEHRRKGIHSALFAELCLIAEEHGEILHITSTTSATNKAAQAAFENQGRRPASINYTFDVEGV